MNRWLFLLFFGLQSLNAEISSVQIIWNPANCNPGCAEKLAQNFQKIPGVANIQMNIAQGSVDFAWNPAIPLNFSPINAAFSLAGPSIDDFRVTVRGVLSSQGSTFSLNSIGDNTSFLLLGALQQQPGRYTVPYSYNPVNYPLDASLIQQFTMAAQQQQPVIVSGQILAPERSPPWMLIVRNVQVAAVPVAPAYGQPYMQSPYAAPYGTPYGQPYGQSPYAAPYGNPYGQSPYGAPYGQPYANPYMIPRQQPIQRLQPIQMQR